MSRLDPNASDAGPATTSGRALRRAVRAVLALAMGLASGALIGQAVHGRAASALPAALVAAVLAMAGLALAWPFVRRGPSAAGGAARPGIAPDPAASEEPEEGPWLLHEGGTLHERLGHSLAFAARHPDHGLALLALAAVTPGQGQDPLEADAALQGLLPRLRAALWPGDAVAVGALQGASREILVLIDRPAGAAAVRQTAEQILLACAGPAQEPGGRVSPPGLRAGGVCRDGAVAGAQEMIRQARQTLQQALADEADGPFLRWFDATQAERRRREQQAAGRLELAWAQAGPELLCEPMCRLAGVVLDGVCVRAMPPETPWFDEDLAPALQPVVDGRVMQRAVALLARWRQDLGARAPAWIGVPACGASLRESRFPLDCMQTLASHQLGPDDLRLLVPEADVAGDAALGARVAQLRAQGLRVVLVGLGSRATSLAFLTQLPVEAVTLGPEVHGGWPARDSGQVRVGGIVGLAQSLGMAVVAQGLVDRAQCEALAALGVTHGQGPVLAPALEVAAMSRWLASARKP